MYHEFIVPDMAFFLDISVGTAEKRFEGLHRDAEIYEKKEKLIKIKEGYDFLLSKFPEMLLKVNAEKGVDEVTQEILSELKKLPEKSS